jgi:hypothetical protein
MLDRIVVGSKTFRVMNSNLAAADVDCWWAGEENLTRESGSRRVAFGKHGATEQDDESVTSVWRQDMSHLPSHHGGFTFLTYLTHDERA